MKYAVKFIIVCNVVSALLVFVLSILVTYFANLLFIELVFYSGMFQMLVGAFSSATAPRTGGQDIYPTIGEGTQAYKDQDIQINKSLLFFMSGTIPVLIIAFDSLAS